MKRPRGPMDKASAYEAGDCGFESRRRLPFLDLSFALLLFEQMRTHDVSTLEQSTFIHHISLKPSLGYTEIKKAIGMEDSCTCTVFMQRCGHSRLIGGTSCRPSVLSAMESVQLPLLFLVSRTIRSPCRLLCSSVSTTLHYNDNTFRRIAMDIYASTVYSIQSLRAVLHFDPSLAITYLPIVVKGSCEAHLSLPWHGAHYILSHCCYIRNAGCVRTAGYVRM